MRNLAHDTYPSRLVPNRTSHWECAFSLLVVRVSLAIPYVHTQDLHLQNLVRLYEYQICGKRPRLVRLLAWYDRLSVGPGHQGCRVENQFVPRGQKGWWSSSSIISQWRQPSHRHAVRLALRSHTRHTAYSLPRRRIIANKQCSTTWSQVDMFSQVPMHHFVPHYNVLRIS